MRYEEAIAVQDAAESAEAVGRALRRIGAAAGKATLAILDLGEKMSPWLPPEGGSSDQEPAE